MATNDIKLNDGYQTTIIIANLPDVKLFEVDVTPPSLEAGGVIDTTTMRNATWRTMAGRSLKTLGQMQATVAFASGALEDVLGELGTNQLITIVFPDGSTLAFYGHIESFTPNAFTEGEMPTAALVVQPTLVHPTTGAETAPVYSFTST